MTKKDGKKLAYAMRVSFGGLKTLLNDPSYNFGFHMFPEECYHWHIEVYPKLTIWAGFEKNTGIFINAVPPEEGAKNLRKVFKKEEKNLGRSNCTY
jgi:UDPglucose--hexose-1-phosphate uridylyltransferase